MLSWLKSIFNFLNNNSSAMTVFITFALVGITFWYTYLTKQMLKSTNTAIVQLFLHHSGNSISLCVQNIGIGFARDIKFKGDLSFKAFNRRGQGKNPLRRFGNPLKVELIT